MRKIICSPGSYIQGEGELKRIADYCKETGAKKAYIIAGGTVFRNYLGDIEPGFEKNDIPYQLASFSGECSDKEIRKHMDAMEDADVVVGIGGGKILDTAKAVAHYKDKPVIIVPTTASTDAPCSRLSVVYTEDGAFDHYLPLTRNPDYVVMDTNVIASAPVRFLMAGIGDALATWYEAAACAKADATTMAGGHITNAALHLAELCHELLLEDALKAKAAAERRVSTKALENIVEANTYLSGVGFESSGLAAAHAIHNGLTVLDETHPYLHGEKVAFGTICQLVLENRPQEEIEDTIAFCRACNLPTTLADLGLGEVSDEKLMEAAAASCAENDTMVNMPFEVSPEDVFAAMKAADQMASQL